MNFDELSLEFANNTLSDYLIATVILVCLIALMKICRRIIFNNERKWVSKTENIDDDAVINILEKNLIPIAYRASIYL